jgi:hypothetical protein
MIQVSIIKDGQVTHLGQFETQELADSWLAKHEGLGTFGQKAETIETQVEVAPAVIESQEMLDENGESFDPPQFQDIEISPAQHEMQKIHIPGYVVEIEDISDELEQEQINKEAQAFLDATDWIVVRAAERGEELSPEFKAERQAARDRIIK